jgi:hypothetical protein
MKGCLGLTTNKEEENYKNKSFLVSESYKAALFYPALFALAALLVLFPETNVVHVFNKFYSHIFSTPNVIMR